MMSYRYIERAYDRHFKPGDRVKHSVTGETGTVMRAPVGDPHYYRVRKDGLKIGSNWHPHETMLAKEGGI